jgi:hypothetical protein
MRRVQTDILILGSGGAGPVRGAARAPARARPEDHRGGEGAAGQVRLHAHGAGRLQRRAGRRRLGRAPLHGHHRRQQVAGRSGPRLDPGVDRGGARPRAGERARLLLRPQPRRQHPPEGVRGPDLRPHGPQGRPHRHRDHQPPGRAGVGARHRPAGGAPRHRAGEDARRRRAGRRADDRHAQRRLRVRAGAGRAAGHRRRPHHVQVPHAVGRQELRRPRDGAARRPAAARHGDGAVPSDRPAGRQRHAHDRHGARGRPARRRRLAAQRRRGALHVALRRARRARHARHRQPQHLPRDARRPHHAQRRRLDPDAATWAPTRCGSSSRAWSSAAPTAASTWPAAASRWCPRPTT